MQFQQIDAFFLWFCHPDFRRELLANQGFLALIQSASSFNSIGYRLETDEVEVKKPQPADNYKILKIIILQKNG
jgi:hypothetical protein